MVEMWGTHGTCRSNAEAICRAGAVSPTPGRIGTGAYFWTAPYSTPECLEHAHKLARQWATNSEKGGQYKGKEDPSVAVVQVKIEIEDNEFISLDDPTVSFRLRNFISKKIVEHLNLNSIDELQGDALNRIKEQVYGIIDYFIDILEKTLGVQFKVIFKQQNCPRFPDVLNLYIGNPSCFAIRDNSCIKSIHYS